jgi:hypothetical protein
MSDEVSDVVKLRFEFYRNIGAVALAALAAAVALINSVFSKAPNRFIALIAIGLFICTAISIHGAQEVLLNRLSPKPGFSGRVTKWIFSPRWQSLEVEYVLSGVSGITFSLGLVLFGVFVVYA